MENKNIEIIGAGLSGLLLAYYIFKNTNKENVVNKSKTTGEPPLMLGMSVFFAIKDAIASVGNYKIIPNINTPATPETILLSINDIKEKI